MLRGENLEMAPRTSPVASLVHIDTDVGAHDVETLVGMVERNQIRSAKETAPFPREEVIDVIGSKRRRFAIVNAWRGVDPDGSSVQRAHLGLFCPRYADTPDALPGRHRTFPALRPDLSRSRWYTYPNLAQDEIILFKQYDRNVERISDIWHCSLPVFPGEEERHPRTSFDCRALVIFDDGGLAEELDRYCDDRLRPQLSLEESGCFCDSQAEKRSGGSNDK